MSALELLDGDLSVSAGRLLLGVVRPAGPKGYQAIAVDGGLVGIFPNRSDAARALFEHAAKAPEPYRQNDSGAKAVVLTPKSLLDEDTPGATLEKLKALEPPTT